MLETSVNLLDGTEKKNVIETLKNIQELSLLKKDLENQIKALEISKKLAETKDKLKELSEPIFKEYGAGLHDLAGKGSFEIKIKVGGETVAFSSEIKDKEDYKDLEKLLRDLDLVHKAKDTFSFGTINIQ